MVLLNGVPGRQFHCKCGVRQGDPLSPLVFVLAADLLQAAVNGAFSRGEISLPFPCNSQKDYPVIQYVDDTYNHICSHGRKRVLLYKSVYNWTFQINQHE